MRKVLLVVLTILIANLYGCTGNMGDIGGMGEITNNTPSLFGGEAQQTAAAKTEECLDAKVSPSAKEITTVGSMTEVLNCSDMNNIAIGLQPESILSSPLLAAFDENDELKKLLEEKNAEFANIVKTIYGDDASEFIKGTVLGVCARLPVDKAEGALVPDYAAPVLNSVAIFSKAGGWSDKDLAIITLLKIYLKTKMATATEVELDGNKCTAYSDVKAGEKGNEFYLCSKGNAYYASITQIARSTSSCSLQPDGSTLCGEPKIDLYITGAIENLKATLAGEKTMMMVPNLELQWNKVVSDADIKVLFHYDLTKMPETQKTSAALFLKKIPSHAYAVGAIASRALFIQAKAAFDADEVTSVLGYLNLDLFKIPEILKDYIKKSQEPQVQMIEVAPVAPKAEVEQLPAEQKAEATMEMRATEAPADAIIQYKTMDRKVFEAAPDTNSLTMDSAPSINQAPVDVPLPQEVTP